MNSSYIHTVLILFLLFAMVSCSNVILESSDDTEDTITDTLKDETPVDETPIDDTIEDDTTTDDDSGSIYIDGGGWLYTSGNKIYTENGEIWYGRGVNIHDTRSNWEASWSEPNVELVKAQIDEAVDVWGADFLRLCLETDPSIENNFGVQYRGILDDPEYLEDVIEIVDYIGTKENTYVLLSLWVEPTTDDYGRPTEDTTPVWECLAEELKNRSHVMYGIINEPHGPESGNSDLLTMYNTIVAAIRSVEDENGTPHHLIAVQGMQSYSRYLEYYLDNPITAGGGENIIYETHVYNPTSDFQHMVTTPAEQLPVIIGEYGPFYMTIDDCGNLFNLAQELKIPLAAWSFHSTAEPCLLEYYGKPYSISPDGPLTPTLEWGYFIKALLSSDYESPAFTEVTINPNSVLYGSSSEINISAVVEYLEGSVIEVLTDLSNIGGGSSVGMANTAGNTYTTSISITSSQAAGDYPITLSAVDNEGNVKYISSVMSVIELATSEFVVYADGIDIRIYPWGSTEDTTVYYDGNESLYLTYDFSNYWAGFGFSLTSGSGLNLAGYGSLEFAYRLNTSSSVPLSVVLGDAAGNTSAVVDAGGPSSDFTFVSIPLTEFTGISLSEVNSVMIQFCDGSTIAASGEVWVDGITFTP